MPANTITPLMHLNNPNHPHKKRNGGHFPETGRFTGRSRPAKYPLLPADTALAALAALLLFGVYMVIFDGRLHSTDGLSMLAVAENMVKHGHFDTRQLENWENVALGLNGHPYTKYAIGPTLLMVPFVAAALAIPGLGLVQTTMVLPPLSGALAAGYIYLSIRRLEYPRKIGLTAALLAGLATPAWSYNYDLLAEPLMLASFAATFYHALAYRQEQQLRHAVLMGLALSLTILHKLVNVIAVPFFFWYAFAATVPVFRPGQWPNLKKVNRRHLAAAAAICAAGLALIGGYNALRFGNPLETGYPGRFTTPVWIGFGGFLISPYKSLLLYNPLVLLLLLNLKKTWRNHPAETKLILTLLIVQMVIFGAWHTWGGGKDWGPRFLVPMSGLLVLLLAPCIRGAFQPGGRGQQVLLAVFALAGVLLQILGISARGNEYLGAAGYWTPPPNFSYWGELSWSNPGQWPVWGHLLRFNPAAIPTIWRWQWEGLNHFDLPSLAAVLIMAAAGAGGAAIVLRRQHSGHWWAAGGWLVAAGCVVFILTRGYDDPRAIKDAAKADKLWPDYSALMHQLPALAGPQDAVIFTDRRFEFYLFDVDKSRASRYVVSKPNQPLILETVPKLLQQNALPARIWLVTDELDNRQLAYATELWLRERGQIVDHHRYGHSLQLTAFALPPSAAWTPIPPRPQLAGPLDPDNHTFNGIASLLGWRWPGLDEPDRPVLPAGRVYKFELYWIYRGKAPEDLFFVRLLNNAGEISLEAITTPRPDSRLIPGQLIIEETGVPVNLPPGLYRLQIGFRTPAVEAGELVFDLPPELTGVQVVPNR